MLILIAFAFLAGIVTILSPCILPILPVVLSGTVAQGKRKPFGIVLGFIASFTFFTLVTSYLVKALGINADFLRFLSIIVIAFLGSTLIIPQLQDVSEKVFSKLSALAPRSTADGFLGGILIGLSIGLVWTPCVGPILAAVIALSVTTSVSYGVVLITLAYAIGTAIPMIAIIYAGKSLFTKIPFLFKNLRYIQQVFGILMILTAIGLATNTDRKFQEFVLEKLPQWGTGLTKIEDNKLVQNELQKLRSNERTNYLDNLQTAPELIAGGEWFNTDPLTMQNLRGKVVLVDFWTYTCINCIRTLPYIRSWHEKYADKGLVIIGVHTPEFEFEKNANNVKKAITDFKLKYPVMQDNNFATWQAYNNHYWPAKYLIDINGKIRYTHFGEGEYDQTEQKIQELLKERDTNIQLDEVANPDYDIKTRTPETYLGYSRLEALETNEKILPDQLVTYTPRYKNTQKNTFDYQGGVLITPEFANPQKGTIMRFNYESKDVFLVMRPKDKEGRIKITIDNQPISKELAGEDIDQNGEVTINEDRLYKLIQGEKLENHILSIEFLDSNTEVFAFTFG